MTISLQLFGTTQCRRYQKMRALALETAAQLELAVHLEEINDMERLTQASPLDLPRLVFNGEVIASRNSPKAKFLAEKLQHIVQR